MPKFLHWLACHTYTLILEQAWAEISGYSIVITYVLQLSQNNSTLK